MLLLLTCFAANIPETFSPEATQSNNEMLVAYTRNIELENEKTELFNRRAKALIDREEQRQAIEWARAENDARIKPEQHRKEMEEAYWKMEQQAEVHRLKIQIMKREAEGKEAEVAQAKQKVEKSRFEKFCDFFDFSSKKNQDKSTRHNSKKSKRTVEADTSVASRALVLQQALIPTNRTFVPREPSHVEEI